MLAISQYNEGPLAAIKVVADLNLSPRGPSISSATKRAQRSARMAVQRETTDAKMTLREKKLKKSED